MRMKGQQLWISGDVLEHLKKYAESGDKNINAALRRALEIPEPEDELPSLKFIPAPPKRKYDVSDMNIGEHRIIPHHRDKHGNINNRTIVQSIRAYMVKAGRLYNTGFAPGGLLVYRAR